MVTSKAKIFDPKKLSRRDEKRALKIVQDLLMSSMLHTEPYLVARVSQILRTFVHLGLGLYTREELEEEDRLAKEVAGLLAKSGSADAAMDAFLKERQKPILVVDNDDLNTKD